jgi:hypothetical protein
VSKARPSSGDRLPRLARDTHRAPCRPGLPIEHPRPLWATRLLKAMGHRVGRAAARGHREAECSAGPWGCHREGARFYAGRVQMRLRGLTRVQGAA